MEQSHDWVTLTQVNRATHFILVNICHQFSGWSALGTFFLSYQILSSLPVFKDAVFLPRSKTYLYQAWNMTDLRLRGLAKDADRVFYHYTSVKILTISPFKFLFGLSPTICNYQLTAALKGNPFERKHMWRPKPTQSSINFLGKPFVLPPGMKFIYRKFYLFLDHRVNNRSPQIVFWDPISALSFIDLWTISCIYGVFLLRQCTWYFHFMRQWEWKCKLGVFPVTS